MNNKKLKGYYIFGKTNYYSLLEEIYFKKNSLEWEKVLDKNLSPVGLDFKDSLKLSKEAREYRDSGNGDYQSKIPLVFSDLFWERNCQPTYIRDLIPNSQDNIIDDSTLIRETTVGPPLRLVPSQSVIRNAVPGYQLLSDKYLLSKMLIGSKYSVPTVFIEKGHRISNPLDLDLSSEELWFLKDPLVNKGEGITLVKNLKDALQHCDVNSRYLLQKEIKPELLFDKYKFDVRVMVVIYFTPKLTRICLYNEGFIRSTGTPYTNESLDKTSQLTNFCFQKQIDPLFENIHPLSKFDKEKEKFNEIQLAVKEIFMKCVKKFNFNKKEQGFTVLGLDFIFDRDTKTPHLLEMNLSPSMFQKSNPHIAEICKKLVSQIPSLFLEPLFHGNEIEDPNETVPSLSDSDFIEIIHYNHKSGEDSPITTDNSSKNVEIDFDF